MNGFERLVRSFMAEGCGREEAVEKAKEEVQESE